MTPIHAASRWSALPGVHLGLTPHKFPEPMVTRVIQSRGELEGHLEEQLRFLEASATSFDSGFEGEAKRLALAIRVLVHETKVSHSLLGQLGLLNARFCDSALENHPKNAGTYMGLVFMEFGGSRVRYVAMLDDVPPGEIAWVDFNAWWERTVFIDKDHRALTRRDLVLAVANQDGGGHVDPALDEVYANLSRHNSMAWFAHEGVTQRPMEGPELAAVRQIAHEVLKTLRPDYRKVRPSGTGGLIVGGLSTSGGQPGSIMVGLMPEVGRNDPCPCGSGKKYKKCHGAT